MKVPENEAVVTLGRPGARVTGSGRLEKDLAIQQERQKLEPRKAGLPTELPDRSRRRQHGDQGRNVRIADPEQGAGARRLQDGLVAAPPQVREPRQGKHVGIAEPGRSRPIVRNLRFDHHMVRAGARTPDAILQETVPRQSPHQKIDLAVDGAAAGREGGERQACTQILCAPHRVRADRAQADRIAVEAGGDFSARVRFQRDMTIEAG